MTISQCNLESGDSDRRVARGLLARSNHYTCGSATERLLSPDKSIASRLLALYQVLSRPMDTVEPATWVTGKPGASATQL